VKPVAFPRRTALQGGMSAVPDNQRAAFEAVALPCAAAVHRFALRLTRDPDSAADLTQEVFLRAYRSFTDFQPGTDCRSWLFAITYSVFINMHRKDHRAPRMTELREEAAEEVSSVEWNVRGDVWTRARIEEALLDLPDPIRLVVVLVLVEELTYEEAAKVLACPLGTVRSRLFRGRRALFTALHAQAAEAGLLPTSRKL
jgi:RNA polymerase sigma-70 factor (ECF subfamily)